MKEYNSALTKPPRLHGKDGLDPDERRVREETLRKFGAIRSTTLLGIRGELFRRALAEQAPEGRIVSSSRPAERPRAKVPLAVTGSAKDLRKLARQNPSRPNPNQAA